MSTKPAAAHAIAVELQIRARQDAVEEFVVIAREDGIHRLGDIGQDRSRRAILYPLAPTTLALPAAIRLCWFGAIAQALVGPNSTRHALAKPNASFATHFYFKNGLTRGIVLDDRYVTVLQVFGLIGPEAGIGEEQDVVVNLLGIPLVVVMEGLTRVAS